MEFLKPPDNVVDAADDALVCKEPLTEDKAVEIWLYTPVVEGAELELDVVGSAAGVGTGAAPGLTILASGVDEAVGGMISVPLAEGVVEATPRVTGVRRSHCKYAWPCEVMHVTGDGEKYLAMESYGSVQSGTVTTPFMYRVG